MKHTKILSIILLIIGASFASEEDMIIGNRKFTAKLFKELSTDRPNQNFVFSPITVQMLLGFITSGTKMNKLPAVKEIINVAELPLEKTKREDAFKNLLEDFQIQDQAFKIVDANKIYFSKGTRVQTWFNSTARDVYNSEVEEIDFADAQKAANNINTWVAKETNNNITNFINPNKISPQTVMLVVNALYLKGKWEQPFEAHNTVDGEFLLPTQSKTVQMMKSSKKTYYYFEDNTFQYLKMKLTRDDRGPEVVFVLPRNISDAKTAIADNLGTALTLHTFYIAEMNIELPKFSIKNNLELKPILQKMGIKKMFDSNGILLEAYHNRGRVFKSISSFSQTTSVDVDEAGVTAVSATVVDVIIDVPNQVIYKDFIANHPFLFYIRVADVIVYVGQVMDPKETLSSEKVEPAVETEIKAIYCS